jgi:hypothetical protein
MCKLMVKCNEKSGFNFTEYILFKSTRRRVRMGCKQSKLGGRIQPVGLEPVKKDNSKRTRQAVTINGHLRKLST